jgi:predicted Zn-ribbon and HTH transcriptional regulator
MHAQQSRTTEVSCKKCGHTWEPRIQHPQACPACMSRKWSQPHVVVKVKRPA